MKPPRALNDGTKFNPSDQSLGLAVGKASEPDADFKRLLDALESGAKGGVKRLARLIVDLVIYSMASIRARCPGALASGESHVTIDASSASARATYMAS